MESGQLGNDLSVDKILKRIQDREMKLCRRCGRYLHDGFAICPTDGAPLFSIDIDQQVIEEQLPERVRNGSPGGRAAGLRASQSAQGSLWRPAIIIPAASALALIAIGVVVYFIIMHNEANASSSAVRSVDELIRLNENVKALDILERWRAANIQTASDTEKMDTLILKLASEASQNDSVDQAIELLKELSPHSSRAKEAAGLMAQLKQRRAAQK